VPPIRYRLWSWAGAQWRTVLVLSVVVAIAGGLVLSLVGGTRRTLTAPDRYADSWGSSYDVAVEQLFGSPRGDELAGLDSVASVEMATFVFAGLFADDGPADALVFAGTAAPLGMRVVDGREADPDEPAEFVATRGLLDASGLDLGDRIQLLTLTTAQSDALGFDVPEPEGPSFGATLVGVLGGPGELDSAGYDLALFPSSLLDQGDIGIAASPGLVGLAPGATIGDLRAEVDGLPDPDAFDLSPAEVVSSDVRDAIRAQGQGLLVLTIVVAISALAVLGQLGSRQLRLSEAEVFAMQALGYTRGQRALEQGARAASMAAFGAVGAIVVAYAASDVFPTGFAGQTEPNPGRHLDLVAHGLGAVAFAVLLVAWVLVALVLSGRPSSVRATPGLVERLLPSLSNPRLATALRFAFGPRSDRRASGRLPLVGLTLVLSVLFGAITFGANMHRLIDDPNGYGITFDVGLGQGGDDVGDIVREALDGSPDVAGLTLYGTTTLVLEAESLTIVGMQPVSGNVVPPLLSGRLPTGEDEIALGPVIARDLDLGIGDEVSGAAASGPRTLRVTGIALIPGIGGADLIGENGLVTDRGFRQLDPDAPWSEAGLDLAEDAPPGAADRIAEATGMSVGGQFDPPAVLTNLDRVRQIPTIVAVAVGALGVLSLAHLMLMGVRRRRRDFAILRTVGAERRWLTHVVHWQATVTTLIVLVISVPLGTLAGASTYRRFVENIGARPDSIFPFARSAIVLVALLVLANVVAALTAQRVRHDSPAEVLAAG
jgi:hypothetical protein